MLGAPVSAERDTLGSGQPDRKPRRPSAGEQGARLGAKWTALSNALDERRAALSTEVGVTDPELILVFEVVGTVDGFINAVRRIEGFEYLAEIDEDAIEDPAFQDPDNEDQAPFAGSLYLIATNQAALSAVLNLWQQYQADESAPFPRNLGRWRDVFRMLADVRRWGPNERLQGTGIIEDLRERVARGDAEVPAEIELWYRDDEGRRSEAEAAVTAAVGAAGGAVVTSAVIGEIGYHALLARLPVAAIQPLLDGQAENVALVRAEAVAFMRPQAQAVVTLPQSDDLPASPEVQEAPRSDEPPLVGILDGVPLAAHKLLDGALQFDDPDDWDADVQAKDRQHGTAMASLVANGQLGKSVALSRRVYLRPILTPTPGQAGDESIPEGVLAIDLVYRSVLRLRGVTGETDSGREVRLVNLAVADRGSPLATQLSPWARLLDYLAYKYDLLFVVAAGNQLDGISFPFTKASFEALTGDELRRETLQALVLSASRRRLFSPSEAMSALTVGASHDDESGDFVAGARWDLLPGCGTGPNALPSPASAIGLGYRRSVKPDLLAPGGRLLYRIRPAATTAPCVLECVSAKIEPGVQVASPSGIPGAIDRTAFIQGTSAATAIVSHYGGRILELLSDFTDPSGTQIEAEYWAVLTKALLVHSCSLPPDASQIRQLVLDLPPDKRRDAVMRFFGYGVMDAERVLNGVPSRATALGWGTLENEQAARFAFPLPPSLSKTTVPRRLTITLGYFPPIRPRNRLHRAAELFFRPDPDKTLRVSRRDGEWRTVKKGTVQHEILEGEQAAAFVDGDVLDVQVNCRALGGSKTDPVPFGLAVTVECDAALPIYAEVSTRLRARAQARV